MYAKIYILHAFSSCHLYRAVYDLLVCYSLYQKMLPKHHGHFICTWKTHDNINTGKTKEYQYIFQKPFFRPKRDDVTLSLHCRLSFAGRTQNHPWYSTESTAKPEHGLTEAPATQNRELILKALLLILILVSLQWCYMNKHNARKSAICNYTSKQIDCVRNKTARKIESSPNVKTLWHAARDQIYIAVVRG